MMSDSQHPETWTTPVWHPDWGDPRAELEHLRDFSKSLLKRLPSACVELKIIEPGYMYVLVRLACATEAGVYSNKRLSSPGGRLLDIFVAPGEPDGDELDAQPTSAAVDYFVALQTKKSNDRGRNS